MTQVYAGDRSRQSAQRVLRDPESFAAIANEGERSAGLFSEMMKVIAHPRCVNCHPRTDAPTQGDRMLAHMPPVVRGPKGHGMSAMGCDTCHGPGNVTFPDGSGSVPGDPHWALAPATMAWAGKSPREICEQIKDPSRNGGRSLDGIIEHNTSDGLVGWAWNPGVGREPAPGSQALFGRITAAWVQSGAHCPQ
jgi:hypothetical protein